MKLWEAPYYDSERRAPQEAALHELAVTLKADLDLPLPHLFQGLLMLQQHALEKLAARDRSVLFYLCPSVLLYSCTPVSSVSLQ